MTTQKTMLIVSGKVWETYLDAASGQWIGVCDQLGITASGLTYEELSECMKEATELVLEELSKNE